MKKETLKVVIEGHLTLQNGKWVIGEAATIISSGAKCIDIGKVGRFYMISDELLAFEDHTIRMTIEDI